MFNNDKILEVVIGAIVDIVPSASEIQWSVDTALFESSVDDSAMQSVGMDSLDAVNLLTELAERTGLALHDEVDAGMIMTVGDLVKVLSEGLTRAVDSARASAGAPRATNVANQ